MNLQSIKKGTLIIQRVSFRDDIEEASFNILLATKNFDQYDNFLIAKVIGGSNEHNNRSYLNCIMEWVTPAGNETRNCQIQFVCI